LATAPTPFPDQRACAIGLKPREASPFFVLLP